MPAVEPVPVVVATDSATLKMHRGLSHPHRHLPAFQSTTRRTRQKGLVTAAAALVPQFQLPEAKGDMTAAEAAMGSPHPLRGTRFWQRMRTRTLSSLLIQQPDGKTDLGEASLPLRWPLSP